MITTENALQSILNCKIDIEIETLRLLKSINKVVASDIYCPLDLPPFLQSSMDGYAFAYDDIKDSNLLNIIDIIAAGQSEIKTLNSGTAMRIFTGAPLPIGADTVVMQEKTQIIDHVLIIQDKEKLTRGMNVRLPGAEITQGTVLHLKGKKITPAMIGMLAAMGIEDIEVYKTPSVTLLITGNEIVRTGEPLTRGKVYDSNSHTLMAALHLMGIHHIQLIYVEDELDTLSHTIKSSLFSSDVLIISGGVSVGDFDFVVRACTANGVHTVFHKIKQKPGKPMYFGRKESKLIFGLPGNPGSSLTCFYEYVYPALSKYMGGGEKLHTKKAYLKSSYAKTAGLTHFLKGYFDGHAVTILEAQESFKLKSFAEANCLILIPEETTKLEAGDEVVIHLIPGAHEV